MQMAAMILGIILVILCIKRSNYERNTIKVGKYILKSRKIKEKIKIIFISDLHEKEFGPRNETLLQEIQKCAPDVILVGGDSILCHKQHSGKTGKEDRISVTEQLLLTLQTKYPVYCGLGNHESRLLEKAGYDGIPRQETQEEKSTEALTAEEAEARRLTARLLQAMADTTVLDRREVTLQEQPGITVTGVTLPMSYYGKLFGKKKPALSKEDYERYSGAAPIPAGEMAGETAENPVFRIVLLHSPLYHREAIHYGADLVLSGHFHGGTVRLPFLGPLMTPQFQFFVKECGGLFSYEDGHMIVSRGLGTHSINIRWNNFPELCEITLLPEEDNADS